MLHIIILFMLMAAVTSLQAQKNIHSMETLSAYKQEKAFTQSLKKIVDDVGLGDVYDVGDDGKTPVSFAVIDLKGDKPVIGGVNMEGFIYPASVYKMYVAMEVLKQVYEGKLSLSESYVVRAPNDVDLSSEIKWDPRPLLRDGDTVTIGYLLDLMITRSDNSASNCMIDIAQRVNINETMHRFGWYGSEVTRKFLPRKFEDRGYDTIAGTMTNALHAADFMYRVQTNLLVNPWVSMKMKTLLGMQLDTTKLAAGLPRNTVFYHKTGWWNYYTNDVGIVDDGDVKYIIALFVPVTEAESRAKIHELSQQVYKLMKSRFENVAL